MRLPFKYIVLYIMKTLKDRDMPLVINKNILTSYLKELMNKSYFTIEEKKEISDNFDFEFELDDLRCKYYEYFDIDGDIIRFDSDYISELNNLIIDEIEEFDIEIIHDIDFALSGNTTFLDILGVEIKKELYNFLLDIEKEIEDCYSEMSDLENYVGFSEVDTRLLINKIRKLYLKMTLMLLNTRNLLSKMEHHDLMLYASDMADETNDFDDLSLLFEDDNFDQSDIMYDLFLRSIFTGSDLYISNLRDRLIVNIHGMPDTRRYSRIKFYLYFLELLEREIEKYDELSIELNRIKYRIMNVMDSVYGTTLFMGNKPLEYKEFKEDYCFAQVAVYYFVDELLMYDDEKYKNKDTGTENTMVYLDSIMKKLLIETYYKLTKDRKIIDKIKENELYKVNGISSSFLKDIVEKPKTKIKEK